MLLNELDLFPQSFKITTSYHIFISYQCYQLFQGLLHSVLCMIASANCFHVLPSFSPYHPDPNYICPTFPFCFQQIGTSAWRSLPRTNDLNHEATSALTRDAPVESSECWLNVYYCLSDASNLINSIKSETAEKCQNLC